MSENVSGNISENMSGIRRENMSGNVIMKMKEKKKTGDQMKPPQTSRKCRPKVQTQVNQ